MTVSVSIVVIVTLLNQGPTRGRSPSPGIRVDVAVDLSWIKPAIASVCPSLSSTTVRASARRSREPRARWRSVLFRWRSRDC